MAPAPLLVAAVAATVEAVGAYLALGQPDALHQRFDLGKLQRGEAQAARYLVDHAPILGRAGGGIAVEVAVFVALKVLDDAAGDEFHVAFRCREAYEGASVHQRWARYAHVYLLGAGLEERAHVVAKLRAAHDGVVAEHHALVFQEGLVGDELHAGHEVAVRLVAGGEASRPRGRVFQHGAAIGNAVALGIAHGHAHARVGDAAHKVGLGAVFLSHHAAVALARLLHVDALVGAGGKAIVHPEKRAHLLSLRGSLQHFHAIGAQAHNFAGPHIAHGVVVEVGKARRLARHGVGPLLATDDQRRATQEVAGGDDAVFGEHQHGARALDAPVHIVDALHKGVAHIDEQGHQLGLVERVGRLFAQVHALPEQLVGYLAQVIDLGHRHHRIPPQVRVDDDGLRVGVADAPQALRTAELVELVFELRPEIVAFQTVDGAVESPLAVEGYHAGTLRAEV